MFFGEQGNRCWVGMENQHDAQTRGTFFRQITYKKESYKVEALEIDFLKTMHSILVLAKFHVFLEVRIIPAKD